MRRGAGGVKFYEILIVKGWLDMITLNGNKPIVITKVSNDKWIAKEAKPLTIADVVLLMLGYGAIFKLLYLLYDSVVYMFT